MAIKKHDTNEHGPNLVKYMAHKNGVENKDGDKWQNGNMVKETLLEENENLLEKVVYLRRHDLVFEDLKWVAYAL